MRGRAASGARPVGMPRGLHRTAAPGRGNLRFDDPSCRMLGRGALAVLVYRLLVSACARRPSVVCLWSAIFHNSFDSSSPWQAPTRGKCLTLVAQLSLASLAGWSAHRSVRTLLAAILRIWGHFAARSVFAFFLGRLLGLSLKLTAFEVGLIFCRDGCHRPKRACFDK